MCGGIGSCLGCMFLYGPNCPLFHVFYLVHLTKSQGLEHHANAMNVCLTLLLKYHLNLEPKKIPDFDQELLLRVDAVAGKSRKISEVEGAPIYVKFNIAFCMHSLK